MSVITPLTVKNDIARTFTQSNLSSIKEPPLKPPLGDFALDIINISSLGLEKQQKEIEIDASRKIENIANEVIRVSSTIGRARSIGNLTSKQASELYKKIANLI